LGSTFFPGFFSLGRFLKFEFWGVSLGSCGAKDTLQAVDYLSNRCVYQTGVFDGSRRLALPGSMFMVLIKNQCLIENQNFSAEL